MEPGRLFVFFLLNAFIFVSWFGLQNRKIHSISSRLLMASVLSMAQILCSIFLLGLPWAKLTAVNLIALNTVVTVALLAFAIARRNLLSSLRELARAIKDTLKAIIKGPAVLKILAVLTAMTILWIVFLGILYPPLEWDSLMYHMPAVGHYQQQDSIADPPLPMGEIRESRTDPSIWVNAYPKNIELIFLWTTIILGNDTLADLVQLVFGLIGIIAVYCLARRLGIDRTWSISAGLLFFLTPIVIAQSRSNYIGLSVSALVLTIMALLYPGNSHRHRNEVIVAGIAAGIVLGAKWSGLMFVPVLWLMLVGQRLYWNHSHRLPKLSKVASESGFFLGPALLFGSYWYIKNWLMYGSPLWPFRISFLGIEFFRGILIQTEVLARVFPEQLQNMNALQMFWATWSEIGISEYMHDIRPGGLGPFWFIFAIPAIFYFLRWIIKQGDVAQALIFIAVIVMLLLHPQNWWTRFTIFIAGFGAIAFAKIRASDRRPEFTRIVDIMLVAMIVYSTVASWATSFYDPAHIVALLEKSPALRTSASVRPEIISQAYEHITELTIDKPANIAYGSGLNFTYPLWGSGLKNRVYYIDPSNPSVWVDKLRGKKIKYLMISADSREQTLINKSTLFRRTYFDRRWGYAVYTFEG